MSAGISKRDPIEVIEETIALLHELGFDDLSDEMEVVLQKFKLVRGIGDVLLDAPDTDKQLPSLSPGKDVLE